VLIGNFVKREQCRRDGSIIYLTKKIETRFCEYGFSELFLTKEYTIFKPCIVRASYKFMNVREI